MEQTIERYVENCNNHLSEVSSFSALAMIKQELISRFIFQNSLIIEREGSPWSRFIFMPETEQSKLELKNKLIYHPKIQELLKNLADAENGIPSFSRTPADFHNYNSFYWQLRFLADIGLTADELGIQSLLNQLLLQQLEDGQFMLRYVPKKQLAISFICVTAHLTYCLIRMGFRNSASVNAALKFISTTQRNDGGWHCHRSRQNGEPDENLPSCPSATIHVLRTLAHVRQERTLPVEPAVKLCIHYFKNPTEKPCIYDSEKNVNFEKLRYPPHYSGLDILNLFETTTNFSGNGLRADLIDIAEKILLHWDGKHLLASQKKIPGWAAFHFGKNGARSAWITSLALRSLKRLIE